MTRLRRATAATAAALAGLAATAPSALGADGEGLYGPTNDLVITYFAFGVIVLFTVIPIVGTLIQSRLENRKTRAREEIERLRKP